MPPGADRRAKPVGALQVAAQGGFLFQALRAASLCRIVY
jgi:hypothetical protein